MLRYKVLQKLKLCYMWPIKNGLKVLALKKFFLCKWKYVSKAQNNLYPAMVLSYSSLNKTNE